jgi:hypothetical protein
MGQATPTNPADIAAFCDCAHRGRTATRNKSISPRLMRLYRNTYYQVADVTFRVGHRCADIDNLLRRNRARIAVFITAHNPRSQRKSTRWNEKAQRRLAEDLRRRKTMSGFGSLGRWIELHELVFGPVAPVAKIALKYRQNVIVILPIGRPVWLLTLLSGTT